MKVSCHADLQAGGNLELGLCVTGCFPVRAIFFSFVLHLFLLDHPGGPWCGWISVVKRTGGAEGGMTKDSPASGYE